ncbi:MAG: hypothetical protein WCO38_02990 [Verrucomicrobiota bacterium]
MKNYLLALALILGLTIVSVGFSSSKENTTLKATSSCCSTGADCCSGSSACCAK